MPYLRLGGSVLEGFLAGLLDQPRTRVGIDGVGLAAIRIDLVRGGDLSEFAAAGQVVELDDAYSHSPCDSDTVAASDVDEVGLVVDDSSEAESRAPEAPETLEAPEVPELLSGAGALRQLSEQADAALAVIEALEVDKAKVEGRLLAAYAALHEVEGRQFADAPRVGSNGKVPVSLDQIVTHEIALATGVGAAEVSRRLHLATHPVRHRVLMAALSSGRVSLARALQVAQECAALPDDLVAALEEAVLAPVRDGQAPSQRTFTARLRRLVRSAGGDSAAKRRARGVAARRVFGVLDEDGMGTLSVYASAEQVVAALDRADRRARALRAAGDPRTLDQLRCDLVCDALLNGQPPTTDTPDTPDHANPIGPTTQRSESESSGHVRTDPSTPPAAPTKTNSAPETHSAPGEQSSPQQFQSSGHVRTDAATPPAAPTKTNSAPEQRSESQSSSHVRADPATPPSAWGEQSSPPQSRSSGHFPADPAEAPTPAGPSLGMGPPAHVWIIVPFEVATGRSDAACELPGHGWVTAEHARAIITAPGSIWRTLAVDIDTGRALALATRSYRPTAAMIEHVRAVDGTCRGPGCTTPAHHCDLDHETPWPTGATTIDNLRAKERFCHNTKTANLWQSSPADDEALAWTTLARREYLTYPKNYREALTDPGATPEHQPHKRQEPTPRRLDHEPPPF